MKAKAFAGVDPGAKGAVAILDERGAILRIEDMPTIKIKVGKTLRERVSPHDLARWFRATTNTLMLDVSMVFLERVGGMTGQSASAAFTFGHGCGLVEGVLVGIDMPIQHVTPQRWKKGFALGPDKGAARMKAMQIWPDSAGMFARVKDDGRAEAALIARFGMQNTH